VEDDQLDAVRRRFDARAEEYDSSAMHAALAGAVAAFAAPAADGAVLDVGTGTGLVLRAMADRFPAAGLAMSGIDLAPRMLEVARHHLPGADLRTGDATSLPFDDRSFDLVTCVVALHLMSDTQAVVGEWTRVLRPGGRVVTATFMTSDAAAHGGPNPDRERFDTMEKVSAVMSVVGLRPGRQEVFRHGDDAILIAEWLDGE
jgi:ubiquinone/menaquinone biosynthesis C-methylase UbiE